MFAKSCRGAVKPRKKHLAKVFHKFINAEILSHYLTNLYLIYLYIVYTTIFVSVDFHFELTYRCNYRRYLQLVCPFHCCRMRVDCLL
jgi:hypothetical protein